MLTSLSENNYQWVLIYLVVFISLWHMGKELWFLCPVSIHNFMQPVFEFCNASFLNDLLIYFIPCFPASLFEAEPLEISLAICHFEPFPCLLVWSKFLRNRSSFSKCSFSFEDLCIAIGSPLSCFPRFGVSILTAVLHKVSL